MRVRPIWFHSVSLRTSSVHARSCQRDERLFPNVVYSRGHVALGADHIRLYYGAADAVIAAAEFDVGDIIDSLDGLGARLQERERGARLRVRLRCEPATREGLGIRLERSCAEARIDIERGDRRVERRSQCREGR